MQKKLIALAVAGLVSAPAFAQSNVTIYGVADAYIGAGSHGENDFTGMGSGGLSGSRIGFRGTEDLGNGLKGVFTYEQGFDIDDTTNSTAVTGAGLGGKARQAFVGLAGGFGTITLGRQQAPGYYSSGNYDAFASAGLSPQAVLSGAANALEGKVVGPDAGVIAAAKGLTIAPSTRWDNAVGYTGSFSGLTARAMYSFNGVENDKFEQSELDPQVINRTADRDDDDAYALSLDYANGPLAVGGVYQVVQADEDQKEWLIGASYNFTVVKLMASYQQAKNVGFQEDNDADLWQVGLLVPVGAGNVHLGYGEVDYDEYDAKAKSFAVAYTHALSKRTTAYAGFNYTKNDDGLGLGMVAPASAEVVGYDIGGGNTFTGDIAETGEKSKMFLVGVRHTF